MLLKKHFSFKYMQIGVLFLLLLNCFLTAVPFVKDATENSHYAKTAGFPSQNLPLQDTEESSHSIYLEEQQQYQISLRSKQNVVYFSNITSHYAALCNNDIVENTLNHSFASSLIPERPAYYAFLSLYKLF